MINLCNLYQEANKKPLNVSLFILGEYDTLNDLVKDGAKRLRDNKESSDLDILLQNEPCPPPDRWVRATGWGKCNPSSMYAKDPPSDFDWVKYYDKLRLKTSEYKRSSTSKSTGDKVEQPKKTSTDTQSTETTVAEEVAASSSDLSSDEHHRVGGRLIKVTRAGSDKIPSVTTSPTEPTTPLGGGGGGGGGAKSHFNRATSDSISQSARGPRTKTAVIRSTSDSISQSARAPRSSRAKRLGMFGRKKSSGID